MTSSGPHVPAGSDAHGAAAIRAGAGLEASPSLVARYPRLSTDRDTAEQHNLEWVTPGPSAVRSAAPSQPRNRPGVPSPRAPASIRSTTRPRRGSTSTARASWMGWVTRHSRAAVRRRARRGRPSSAPRAGRPGQPEPGRRGSEDDLPSVKSLPEATDWLNEQRVHAIHRTTSRPNASTEIERIAEHVELSLTEVLQRIDQEIGRASEDVEKQKVTGAEGRLAQAEARHGEVLARRERRAARVDPAAGADAAGQSSGLPASSSCPIPNATTPGREAPATESRHRINRHARGDGAREGPADAKSSTFTRRTWATTSPASTWSRASCA